MAKKRESHIQQSKILIIDDSIDNLKLMVSIFKKQLPTYEILQTSHPEKAIGIARQVLPDLIITDWNMPKISGIELITKFKQEASLKEIPIIVVTGWMLTSDDLSTVLKVGAIDYIRKPIEPIELIARTNSALTVTKYYKQLVEQKNKELIESSMYLVRGQEFNRFLTNKINQVQSTILKHPLRSIDELSKLKEEIQQQIYEDGWYKFNLSFSNAHPNFGKNISSKHPEITPSEIKLCSFIRLGMANKEIAVVLKQTPDTVKVSRYRLRKKLNMSDSKNLASYLLQF